MTNSRVVICPKVIPKIENTYFGYFLFRFLRVNKIKAMVANECWSALKFRIKKKYLDRFDERDIALEKANQHIARMRGWIKPETEILNKFGQDISIEKDFTPQELTEKTIDLIKRKWALINFFISEDPTSFVDVKNKPITLKDFFNDALKSEQKYDNRRSIAEEFAKSYHEDDNAPKY